MTAPTTATITTAGCLQTASGRRFEFAAPTPEQICLEDIALALSHICRFGGHVRRHYSVAEHSVRVSRILSDEHALAGLLHDAAEAFIGDMPTPLKRLDECRGFVEVERRIEAVIGGKFGLPSAAAMHDEVRRADAVLLATEARDLLPRCPSYVQLSEPPLAARIRPWSPRRARAEFLARYVELTGEGSLGPRIVTRLRAVFWRIAG